MEKALRDLDSMSDVLETYVLTGPIFDFESSIELIGERDENGIEFPVPSHFFKCTLAEKKNGKLYMWAFEMENSSRDRDLKFYRVPTSHIEKRAGISVWDNLTGPEIDIEKNKIRDMW